MLSEIIQVSANAECLFDETQVEQAIDRVAIEMTNDLANNGLMGSDLEGGNLEDSDLEHKAPLFLAVMNGGMVPLGKLITRLDFPLQVDFCHATRYRNQLTGSAIVWKVKPHCELQGRTVVVVDDILDEGFTLSEVVNYCRQQGAKEVRSFALVEKLHARKKAVGFSADYVGVTTEDFYLFGYGMDYKGYLRNAAGIFAVSDADLAEFK